MFRCASYFMMKFIAALCMNLQQDHMNSNLYCLWNEQNFNESGNSTGNMCSMDFRSEHTLCVVSQFAVWAFYIQWSGCNDTFFGTHNQLSTVSWR